MKLIEPFATIIRPQTRDNGIIALKAIEGMARISHRSEELMDDGSWDRFLRAVVIDKGDWSVVEHGSASVIFRIDRGITHELVRHRLFSFTQESTRFVNPTNALGRKIYPDGLEFIRPLDWDPTMTWEFEHEMSMAEKRYLQLLKDGVKPQVARSVLPNALASTIGVTGNFRNWRHFFLMRTTVETHPDFRRVTVPLLAEFKARIPLLFDDIDPLARQIENLRKPR